MIIRETSSGFRRYIDVYLPSVSHPPTAEYLVRRGRPICPRCASGHRVMSRRMKSRLWICAIRPSSRDDGGCRHAIPFGRELDGPRPVHWWRLSASAWAARPLIGRTGEPRGPRAPEPAPAHACPDCGGPTVREAGCRTCPDCGWSACG